MDRSLPCRPEHRPAVRAVGPATLDALLRTARRKCRQSRVDASDRRAVFAKAVLRQSQDGVGSGSQSEARAAADASHGAGGALPDTLDVASLAGTHDLPVFAAGFGDHAARPGVVE